MSFNYKKIIKSQKVRFAILNTLFFLPDFLMLKLQYRLKLGKKLNLKNPHSFTEKIQYYKIHYRNPLLGMCVDKYMVREYVKTKGLSQILNDLFFVGDDGSQICFETLPEKFVVKTTDGGGGENIIICREKKLINEEDVINKISQWKDKKNINPGREWAYTGIAKSRIIIEKYLENRENPEAGIEDFKFLCFSGKPKYVVIDKDRYIEHKRNIYTINKVKLDIESDCKQFQGDYNWPNNYSEMVSIAKKLSQDFPFVRVDLYNVDGKIIFGELTFYPWSGYVQFKPDSFDYELGSHFSLDFYNCN